MNAGIFSTPRPLPSRIGPVIAAGTVIALALPIFAIAGIWRQTADVGEAFTMLTMPPGPDIAPYHDRQIVILEREAWSDWLDPSISAKSLIRPLAEGSLSVEQVG